MVDSVLLPVQPKKIGIAAVFILAVSTMIFFFSSGESIEVSPVEPMIRIAEVPLSAWNLSSERNASKSTEPSLLKGVIRATNEPVSFLADISISGLAIWLQIPRFGHIITKQAVRSLPLKGLQGGGLGWGSTLTCEWTPTRRAYGASTSPFQGEVTRGTITCDGRDAELEQ